MTGTDAPQAMAWAGCIGLVVVQTLVAQNIAVIVNTRGHDAGAQGDVLHRLELGHGGFDPVGDRLTVNFAAINNSAATPSGGLLHQQNLLARLGSDFSGLQASHTATDNNDVSEEIEMLVGVAVFLFFVGRFAQTRRLAHEGLVNVLPEAARVEEHLVIETRRQETSEIGVDRADVEFQRRPMVLAGGT